MLEREIAMKKAVGDGLGFEDDPFGPMQAHSFDHRLGFSPRSSSPLAMVPRLPEPVPDNNLEVNKELTPPARPPELNKDKLIVLVSQLHFNFIKLIYFGRNYVMMIFFVVIGNLKS